MNNKTLTSLIIGVVIIVAAIFLVMKGNSQSGGSSYNTDQSSSSTTTSTTDMSTSTSGTTTSSATTTTSSTGSSYTLAQVATHKDATSCWTTINGNVYDLTRWISQHPGGEGAILSICGKDGTAAFENQHSTDRRPNQILATFKIGVLAK